jgi:hypothetical protein
MQIFSKLQFCRNKGENRSEKSKQNTKLIVNSIEFAAPNQIKESKIALSVPNYRVIMEKL